MRGHQSSLCNFYILKNHQSKDDGDFTNDFNVSFQILGKSKTVVIITTIYCGLVCAPGKKFMECLSYRKR